MALVVDQEQILDNVEVFYETLELGEADQQAILIELLKKSKTFLVVKVEDMFLFAPSYFIGSKDQTVATLVLDHYSEVESNTILSTLLGTTPKADKQLDENFLDFCDEFGINRNDVGSSRDYWVLDMRD